MRVETLKKNYEFLRAYRSRKNCVSPLIVTYVVPRKKGGLRLGITTGKKVGCAVQRNRARRIVRAAVAELLAGICGSYDVVIVCRSSIVGKKTGDVTPILREHLTQLGVLKA